MTCYLSFLETYSLFLLETLILELVVVLGATFRSTRAPLSNVTCASLYSKIPLGKNNTTMYIINVNDKDQFLPRSG